MNADLASNKITAVGVVCGILGLASMVFAVLAVGLGLLARRRGEKVWWCAVVAGVVGFFGGPQLDRLFGPLGG